MPSSSPPRRVPWLPLLGLGLVLLAAAGAFLLARGERAASGWVARTIWVQLSVARFEEAVVAHESAYRGYLVRPTAGVGADIAETRARAYATLAELRRATADNPAQQRRIARLHALLDEKVRIGRWWLGEQRAGRLARSLVTGPVGRGWATTRMIRAVSAAMTAEEAALLETRQARARRLSAAIGWGLSTCVVLVLLVAWTLVRDAQARTAEMEARRDEALAAGLARAEAEAKLRQIQKMEAVGQLTGGIAHDFNNMLAIVIGSLDLAARRMADPVRLRRALDTARDGAERAAALTGRLLAFARQSPLAPMPLDANRLIAGMSDLLRRTLGETIRVDTVLAPGLWPTFADPHEVENALVNLGVNARDAMAARPLCRLTISTANVTADAANWPELAPGDYVMVEVADTGCGMSAETVSRAFDPFFTTKALGKGTGLGLSQVFGFARQSGGHVAIRSEPGQGTRVSLFLPRHHAAAEPAAAVAAGEAPPAVRGGELVLVCEDEARVRAFSVEALRELGYGVLAAPDGEAALRLLGERPEVSLLFTDVVMPGMGGRRLVDHARRLRPDLRVLFTTGYAGDGGPVDTGGQPVLGKPFTIDQLARRVRDALDAAA